MPNAGFIMKITRDVIVDGAVNYDKLTLDFKPPFCFRKRKYSFVTLDNINTQVYWWDYDGRYIWGAYADITIKLVRFDPGSHTYEIYDSGVHAESVAGIVCTDNLVITGVKGTGVNIVIFNKFAKTFDVYTASTTKYLIHFDAFDGRFAWAALQGTPGGLMRYDTKGTEHAILEFSEGNNAPRRLVWDGRWLWITFYDTQGRVMRYDTDTFVEANVDYGSTYGDITAITYDGFYVWVGFSTSDTYLSKINRYSLGHVEVHIDNNLGGIADMEFDGNYVLAITNSIPTRLITVNADTGSYAWYQNELSAVAGPTCIITDGIFPWVTILESPPKLVCMPFTRGG